MRIREGLAVCLAALLLGWSSGAASIVAAQQPASPQESAAPQTPQGQPPPADAAKPEPAPAPAQLTPEQQDLAALSQAVDAAAKGGQAPGGISMRWVDNHFIRSQGDSVYVPFTIEVDRKQLTSPSAALYVRVVDKGAAPPAVPAQAGADFRWNTLSPVTVPENGIVSHAIALTPGTYDAFIAVKERATNAAGEAPTGVLRQELVVPNFGGDELAMSSVILARAIGQLAEPLPAAQQQEHPYTFVTLQVQPAHDGAFTKSGQLHLLFWIYNAAHDGGKPDVQVEYQFHHRLPDGGVKYFNKTAPQALNAETLPPEFNLTAGHQLLSNLSIPLASFAEGGYRLEITVTDKKSGKSLTRNVDFSVSA